MYTGTGSSRSVHPNPCVETHLFSNSAKSLDIARLNHKNSRYIGSAKLQEILIMRTRNKGARGGRGGGGLAERLVALWHKNVHILPNLARQTIGASESLCRDASF